jgi:hypothetical protein
MKRHSKKGITSIIVHLYLLHIKSYRCLPQGLTALVAKPKWRLAAISKIMKNYVSGMKFKTLLFLLVAGIMFSYVSRKPGLTGKWIICNPDGSPSGEYIDFYKKGTYDITCLWANRERGFIP